MGNADDPDPDRYRTQARRTASQRNIPLPDGSDTPFPTHHPADTPELTQAGGLSTTPGLDAPPSASPLVGTLSLRGGHDQHGTELRDLDRDLEKIHHNHVGRSHPTAVPPPAPPTNKSQDEGAGPPAIESDQHDKNTTPPIMARINAARQRLSRPSKGSAADLTDEQVKIPIVTRMMAGCKRFGLHFKDAMTHSWVNLLLVFVPVGIAAEAVKMNPGAVFGINAIAIIPLAGLLTHATEAVASRLGDTWGALLNVTFGNSVELIIFIIALVKGEIRIVQASILGSILANLLLILGMAFFLGGLFWHEQIYNNTVTQMSACLLSISVMSLLLPTAFHASFKQSSVQDADTSVLKVSRGTSVILLLVYILYLFFQLRSHKALYESTPQHVIDEESHPGMLADMMNSSSSDSSSSSSSSDSDSSSNSGSIVNKAKRVKRIFRKGRKSSASTISSANGPEKVSSFSSPSTQERDDPLEESFGSYATSRRASHIATLPANEGDADHEDNGTSRNFDWATNRQLSVANLKSQESKKRHKKHKRKEKQEAHPSRAEPAMDNNGEPAHPKVEFANNLTVTQDSEPIEQEHAAQSSSRMPFNMRQFSSLARPGLTKMLSNTVFMHPPPSTQPPTRPPITRSQSAGNLRRTTSLPDRANPQTQSGEWSQVIRKDPLPPFQHRRFPVRKSTSKRPSGADDAIDSAEEEQPMSRTSATVLLLISTALVAVCAEFMVDAIPAMIGDGDTVSEAFIGLIILPIVGNAAEHVTAVTVAMKNKVDLAIGVAVGSSIQIALFVTPLVVLIGWILDTEMSLYFNLFETVSLFVTVFVVNFLVLDGRSNYLEGALLMAAYVIIALVSFFYPSTNSLSSVGGGTDDA